MTRDGKAYQAVLTPISFPGWSLVTVVPESEFLGPVQTTIRNLLIGLAVLIVFAGLLSAWLAQRLIAAPLIKVVNEIRHVERFDLDKVQRHPSRLTEIENLSGAIGDMAQGLAAFRKYIPADLVKRLISDGNGARLGGAVRPMSVMFIDLAGFTGMSERLGDRIIPLLSRYFDMRLGADSEPGRHHRQVHRRCRDGVLGRAVAQSRITPSIAAAPRWRASARWRRPVWSTTTASASRSASASIPATCWSAISARKCG